ncbi:MAG: penicillin-binding transpeptidase domain-containing protein [Candidatus Omnitrophota bacterium]
MRLAFIQCFRYKYLSGLASKQHNLFLELEPKRGAIYDTRLRPLALNIPTDSVYAVPVDIKDKEGFAKEVSSLMQIDKDSLRQKINQKKQFVWILRKLDKEKSAELKRYKIKGIGFIRESKRSYPNHYLASHVIGFAGIDNIGLEGLELSYDRFLKGSPGLSLILRDARQRGILLGEEILPSRDGANIVLNIDSVIQFIAERHLDEACSRYHPQAASIVVLDPKTGKILALANRPTYDLNDFKDSAQESRRNRAITDMFEPGSVFKIVTASCAIENNKVKEEDKIFCENGTYKVANHILHDHTPHGWLTFRDVIRQSSNIGTTKVAQILGPQLLYNYVRGFGFGSRLGVDLIGEIPGSIKAPSFWSKTSIGAVPIGQEVGVTALQLASAISVIANQGRLMRPFLVDSVLDNNNEVIKKFEPKVLRQVISEKTALRVKEILVAVIEGGTGKLAKIDGVRAAGKTGTAQKLEPNGAYSHAKFIGSFIGFAPADDPVIAVAIVIDEPMPVYYGGVVAAPVFKDVAGEVLRYLGIKPKEESKLNEIARISQ